MTLYVSIARLGRHLAAGFGETRDEARLDAITVVSQGEDTDEIRIEQTREVMPGEGFMIRPKEKTT